MARPLRIEYEGALYHVTSRGNHKSAIFTDDEDRHAFLELLADIVSDLGWICHAYCLMSNHYHLVIETPNANLCKGMRQLNGVFTQASNRRHGQVGHLFQGRYKSIIVDADAYLLELTRYVALNPVRAGMVKDVSQWVWSSYRAMAGLEDIPGMLSVDPVLACFSGQKSEAQQLFANFVAEGINKQDIWSELQHQIFLGHDDFVAKVQAKAKNLSLDSNIPKVQQQAPAKSLKDISAEYANRKDAIVAAYQTGAYSYSQIANHFNIHFTTVGRIVRSGRKVLQ